MDRPYSISSLSKKPTEALSQALNSQPVSENETESTSPTISVQSVSGLNQLIRQQIEGGLSILWVQGEISNFKAHSSGHHYMSLKDDRSQIRAVMFRGANSRLKFKPSDGLEVIVRGRVTVYEPRGEYQITIDQMEPVGAGALQKAFEQLKIKLKAEGLFDSSRKRPLPGHPRHVAIVTSPTGAAIQDMINILSRRNKTVQVTLVPTIVQGPGAAAQIIEALKKSWQLPDLDVVIIGRGGGSIEDLWAFNDEALARAISESPVPVISAVGHEVDFTIADFVADLRAPTPSAAAELVAKSSQEVIHRLAMTLRLLTSSIHKVWRMDQQKVKALAARLIDPQRRIADLQQRNDELLARLQRQMQSQLRDQKKHIHYLMQSMISPEQTLLKKRSQIQLLQTRMTGRFERHFSERKSHLEQAMAVLDSLSPLRVVERGYSLTEVQGRLLKSSKDVKPGDQLYIHLMHGQVTAQVLTTHEKESAWTLKKN